MDERIQTFLSPVFAYKNDYFLRKKCYIVGVILKDKILYYVYYIIRVIEKYKYNLLQYMKMQNIYTYILFKIKVI